MKDGIKIAIFELILLLILAGLLVYFLTKPPKTETVYQDVFVEVPKIKVVEKITKVPIEIPGPVQVIEKEKVVEVLKLPDWVKNDTEVQVLAAGEVKPYKGKTQVISLLDIQSGEGSLIQKQLPLARLELISEKEIGVRGDGGGEIEVFGRWRFLRTGKFYWGLYGEASSSENKAMLEVSYQF